MQYLKIELTNCSDLILSLNLFSGYAELRDHVQIHGDGYKDPLATLQRSPGKSKQNQKKQIKANILNTSNERKDTNDKVNPYT